MTDVDFKAVKKPYFLGIGGIGVSAIARMMMHEGKQVAGSDTANSDLIDELRKAGAEISIGNDLSHIPEDTDLVIYSIAVPHYDPEFFEGIKSKFKNVLSYPQVLSLVSKDKYTIAIAGTHGKTTTTAMVAKILIDAGFDPTVIVGSILNDSHTNFIAGKSKYLVVEACEYKRSFLEINPTVVGITTIDDDHLDYYKDHADIVDAFEAFKAKVPADGAVIETGDTFDLNLRLKIPGDHNRKNATLALAIAEFLGIDRRGATRSLENFSGTWRRFEYKGKTASGALVYDDYGHHPAEIAATLAGARELYPDKKITLVFQPHLYSRTKFLFDDFVRELAKADSVILAPIYFAREEPDPTVSSRLLADAVAKINKNTCCLETFEEIKNELLKTTGQGDIILVMGAGDITNLGDMLIK